MSNPIAAGATALGGVMSFKGKQAEAKQVQQSGWFVNPPCALAQDDS